jgi:hypothetical protein
MSQLSARDRVGDQGAVRYVGASAIPFATPAAAALWAADCCIAPAVR